MRNRALDRASRGTYGSPRVHAALQREGCRVGRNRVARLMRAEGLWGRRRRRWCRTTDSDHQQSVAANVLARAFQPTAPDRVWATDITHVWTSEGWLSLAVVLDLFARRLIGWALAEHLRTELVSAAFTMAVGRRQPPTAVAHHSDRGSQYASASYQQLLRAHGLVGRMSRPGNCWDNAVVESFFATLKTELIAPHRWATRAAARTAIAEYIEGFYHSQRLHSYVNYRTPLEAEKEFRLTAAQAAEPACP